jgi:hypothetical protein
MASLSSGNLALTTEAELQRYGARAWAAHGSSVGLIDHAVTPKREPRSRAAEPTSRRIPPHSARRASAVLLGEKRSGQPKVADPTQPSRSSLRL